MGIKSHPYHKMQTKLNKNITNRALRYARRGKAGQVTNERRQKQEDAGEELAEHIRNWMRSAPKA